MRILIVAMSNSVHTARWISQICDQGWDIHLFPSVDSGGIHKDLKKVTVYHSLYSLQGHDGGGMSFRGLPVIYESISYIGRKFLKKYFPNYQTLYLAKVITKVKPDIIHSMEIQAAGYLTLEAKRRLPCRFPPCIITNWGSDIYLFGRLAEHTSKIRQVLAEFDYYSCECNRDVELARSFGFRGKVLAVFPNGGGYDLGLMQNLRQPGRVSERRIIVLKGYQHWAGRALVGLRALKRCSNLLKEYKVVIFSATPDVEIAAQLFQGSTGIPVEIIAKGSSHHDILRLQGQSRISIGLSISDAISTSLLEALVMGAFPIQSWTSCADEWIENGKNGILVPPEDPEVVEQAIRRALEDDELVNQAAEKNYQLTAERLDRSKLRPKSIELYKSVLKEEGALIEK